MSDYSQTTNFTAKDSLPSGNPGKVVKGSDFDLEFSAVESASATKANKVSAATANNLLMMDGNGDLADSTVTSDGSGNLVATNVTADVTGDLTGSILDSNGNELLTASTTASAVNEVTLANAASGLKPTLTQTGTDDVGILVEDITLHNGDIDASTGTITTLDCTGFTCTAASIASRDGVPRRVLLDTQSTGGAANLDLTTAIDSTYDRYEIEVYNMFDTVDNSNLILRVFSSAAWQATGYTFGGSTLQTGITFAANSSNQAPEAGFCGVISLWRPSGTSNKTRINIKGSVYTATPGVGAVDINGQWDGGNTAVTGIRFLPASGSVSGEVRLYGVT